MYLLPPDRDIAALVPVYTEAGDYTRIIVMNGEEMLIPCTLRSVMKRLAKRTCKDVSLMRSWASKLTQKTLNNPLPINASLVLAPFKARLARVEGDETMGRVNPCAVARIEGKKRSYRRLFFKEAAILKEKGKRIAPSSLILTNGRRLESLWTIETLSAHLNDGKLVQGELMKEMLVMKEYLVSQGK